LIRGIGLLFSQTATTFGGQENALGDCSIVRNRPARCPCCSGLKFAIFGRYPVGSTPTSTPSKQVTYFDLQHQTDKFSTP